MRGTTGINWLLAVLALATLYFAAGLESNLAKLRSVTVFVLEDLVRMAREKGRHCLLIARECGLCGMTRANALRPLLTERTLKCWSELVMDVATARELLTP
jgi:hypothetical protein